MQQILTTYITLPSSSSDISDKLHLTFPMQKCLEVYHTNVHIILRRTPWPPVQTGGNRALHVLHTLFTNQDNRDAQLLKRVRPKKYPPADKVSLKLLEKGKRTSNTLKLSETLARLEPFSYLVQTEAGTEETPGTYQIQKFPDPGLNNNGRKIGPSSKSYYKRNGRSKEVYINPDCSADLLRRKLKLSYHFLLEGSRVEWHLRPKSLTLRPKSLTKSETVDWALRHQLHLRPDAILAAMPPGTTMLAVPGMILPSGPQDPLTKKLSKIKTSDVFWAMENRPILRRLNIPTPRPVRQLGTWTDHTKSGNTRRSKPHETRPFGKDPDREMEEGDMPDLSDLMPERERNDDGSSPVERSAGTQV